MLDMALVGFRYDENFKVFKVAQGNTSPETLGNNIAAKLSVQVSWLTNDSHNYGFFYNINQPNEKNKERYSLPDIEKRIDNADFSFFNNFTIGRRRTFRQMVIPNDNLELDPFNILKYKWAYIYNFKDKKLEFYGKGFPFVHELKSPIEMPYFAGININSIAMINGIQRFFDVIQFLPRIHEQEYILQKSITKEKPHKHSETRKKSTRRSYY